MRVLIILIALVANVVLAGTNSKVISLQALIRDWPNPNIPNQFFRIMDDEVPIMVGPCGHFFEQDEYEMVRQACV